MQSFTLGRPSFSPAERSASSIARQPSRRPRYAAPLEERVNGHGGHARRREAAVEDVRPQELDRLVGVLLVGADHAARAALDPAGAVLARDQLALAVDHPSAVVGDRHRSARRRARPRAAMPR